MSVLLSIIDEIIQRNFYRSRWVSIYIAHKVIELAYSQPLIDRLNIVIYNLLNRFIWFSMEIFHHVVNIQRHRYWSQCNLRMEFQIVLTSMKVALDFGLYVDYKLLEKVSQIGRKIASGASTMARNKFRCRPWVCPGLFLYTRGKCLWGANGLKSTDPCNQRFRLGCNHGGHNYSNCQLPMLIISVHSTNIITQKLVERRKKSSKLNPVSPFQWVCNKKAAHTAPM